MHFHELNNYNKMTPRYHLFVVPFCGCSYIKNCDVPFNNLELVACSVQDCNIMHRDSHEPDQISPFTFRKQHL